MANLFRKEAVEAHSQKLHGEISLAQPVPLYIIISCLFITIAVIAIYLSFSQYARKETVQGYLIPDKGVIKTYASTNGTLAKLHVKEGQSVSAGTPLATIVIQRNLLSGTELSESLLNELNTQTLLLNQEQNQHNSLQAKEQSRLQNSLDDITTAIALNTKATTLAKEKLRLYQQQLAQHKKLYSNGYLSEIEYQAQQEKFISIQQEVTELDTKTLQLQREKKTTQTELDSLPHQYQLKAAEIHAKRSELKRRKDETENSYRFVIKASESGIVTTISVVEGEYISANRPLMSIIPENATLVAELLLPTRSAGFIRVGDEARLRFDAFPYQRFGTLTSHIARVDKVIVLEGEADLPVSLSEPVYRIRTHIDKQNIKAYGESFPLKSGMLLEADIILDKRPLIKWLFEPIYSLNGRVG
ncbi:HlyD family efflux transporter periplasmic adaptor subunit [uncultured Shewanella sp.]|uniref:HlyD family secretion protein n=1 Tax=uncultured Shewanella sp. TaxID=173975 RepID=UPI0026294194|nr:HlyD family efflux transporter periplasmic adaptor subunit [uncultured Shewanella sp.]